MTAVGLLGVPVEMHSTLGGYDRYFSGGAGQTDTTAAPADRDASRIGPSPLPQQSLADRALALSEQVARCHGALDAMNWPGVPDDSQKDATEPGLEQHLQRAEHGASGLLKRLTALADHVGRL